MKLILEFEDSYSGRQEFQFAQQGFAVAEYLRTFRERLRSVEFQSVANKAGNPAVFCLDILEGDLRWRGLVLPKDPEPCNFDTSKGDPQ